MVTVVLPQDEDKIEACVQIFEAAADVASVYGSREFPEEHLREAALGRGLDGPAYDYALGWILQRGELVRLPNGSLKNPRVPTGGAVLDKLTPHQHNVIVADLRRFPRSGFTLEEATAVAVAAGAKSDAGALVCEVLRSEGELVEWKKGHFRFRGGRTV